ncbi:MAG: hypothetical protein CVT72_02280 [Alphaproteobacteria bacterium HGW-Alphaproteobacteria-11]|nr:MAG: hypothetical protein CVT72_02280 [Alphaproteobacteria bacterium HGW-Alphaproteobacteria-11]
MARENSDTVKELIAIKKLLVLALANSGMRHAQIAAALDIDRTGVGRMFPKGTLSNLKTKGDS